LKALEALREGFQFRICDIASSFWYYKWMMRALSLGWFC